MKQSILFPIMIFLSLLAVTTAQAHPLWGGARVGMTPDEVQKTVKNAQPISDGHTLAVGAKALLKVDNVRLANENFEAHFFFLDNKLIQVTLKLKQKRRFEESVRIYKSLLKVLRQQHGKETASKINDGAQLRMATADWQIGERKINVTVITFGTTPAIFNLNYQSKYSAVKR